MQRNEDKKKVRMLIKNETFYFIVITETNKLREAGGYNFSQAAIHGQQTNFNFGGSANTSFQNPK